MKAAQLFSNTDIRVVDAPEPTLKQDEALLSIEWCGICGSDLHEYLHGPSTTAPHPLSGEQHLPMTMGHEVCARVLSAPQESGLKEGDAVIVDPRFYCLDCSRCRVSHTHGCATLGLKGFHSAGGFAERMSVQTKHCHRLPPDVDLRLAALIEPLAVAWHAVTMCEVDDWASKRVLVLGGGPIGIATTYVLQAKGCGVICISEPTATRAAQNKGLTEHVVNPVSEDVVAKCMALTDGEGVDVVFDCAGVQKGMDAGVQALRFRGVYMNIAMWASPMVVPVMQLLGKELTIKASITYSDAAVKETVEAFAAGKFNGLEGMVTSRIYLDDVVEKGFEELIKNKDHHIKIMVTPRKDFLD